MSETPLYIVVYLKRGYSGTLSPFVAAITSKKRDIPLQFWIIFFGVVTVALIAALAGLIFMLCEINCN